MEDSPHLFRFDLDLAIKAQLIEKLEASPRLPLTKSIGPQLSGIYVLYWKDNLVYIGKATRELTQSKRDLRARLNEHIGKIGGRANIQLAEMSCRFLTFESEWWVFAAEFALVTHYNPGWQSTGFGSKTPGRGRPGTERIGKWDQQFPKRD